MRPDRSQFRDAHRYLAAVASEVVRPALRAYARSRSRGAPTPPSEWRRGVILGATHIGDVLYRTCSLAQLHDGLPECRWTYVATSVGAELLASNPALSDVLVMGDGDPTLAQQLAQGDFDVALCTDNIQHHTGLGTAVRAGIPNRVAFGSKGLTGLATLAVPVRRASWPEQFAQMVRAVTGATVPWPLRPRIHLTESDTRDAAAVLDALPHPDAPLTLAAAVTTRQRLGVFPPSLFAEILRRAIAIEPGARIVLTGSSDDRAALEAVAAAVGDRTTFTAGALTVRATVALLSRCDAFLGSDSGPRHMANAAGIPVFFVRNMAVPEIEAGRYCDSEVDLAPPGQYLGAVANVAALDQIDPSAAAASLVAAARRHRATAR